MLSQAQQPLPDPGMFYRAVRDNLVRAERINHLYTYKERRTDIHTNPFGKLGTGGVSLFEVYPSLMRRLTYRRLVARDGKPLTAAELAEQDRAYRARVAEVRQSTPAGGADRRLDEESTRARERGQRSVDDVVNTLAFTLDRRETYNGVPAIVITFAPKPDAEPTTRQGRIAQKFVGTIWVDEAAAEVMQMDAKSIDDISIGFGIVARLSEGTTVTVSRRRVVDGLWMPTKLTMTGHGRAALYLRRLNIDFAIEWFDYGRLPEESLAPFLDARVHGEAGGRP